MKRVVVVGGGISGTAAAWTASAEAERHRRDVEVILLERENQVGGKAHTAIENGWVFESGPLGYLNDVPEVDELVDAVGLRTEALTASSVQNRRFVYLDERVRRVPTHPLGFLASRVLSLRALARIAREPWVPGRVGADDESVWEFAARRLGPELADRLIHPMALGIFAGDAKRLSLPSAFPIMAELERSHGSLIRAQIARSRARRRGELPPRRRTLCSLRRGLQSLPSALSERGRFETRTSVAVTAIGRGADGRWRVETSRESDAIPADAVVLACEGWQAASMLRDSNPELAKVLDEIPYPPVTVVGLGYPAEARRSIPEGFGVLIPRDAGYRALGVTCDGYLFPRGAEDGLMVRVLLGGTFDPDVASLDDDEVVRIAEREISRLFGFSTTPIYQRARSWRRAIPQYELGHGGRVTEVEKRLEAAPGLHLAGNTLYGTSFGKAAARGVLCGRRVVEQVRASSHPPLEPSYS